LPIGQNQPDDVADHAKRTGADVVLPEVFGARHRFLAERQQCIDRDVEGCPRPGDADDGNRHDDGGDRPAERHLETAEHDPEDVEQDGDGGHGQCSLMATYRHIGRRNTGSSPGDRQPRLRLT
jgi:hypothetical protein